MQFKQQGVVKCSFFMSFLSYLMNYYCLQKFSG